MVWKSGATATSGLAALTQAWTQRVGGHVALPLLLRELGVDPAAILAEAGLAGDALCDAEARVPYVEFGRLLYVAAERTGCAHLGLLAGRMLKLSDLGRLGAAVQEGPTVRDALRTFVADQYRDSEGGLAFLADSGATTELGYAIYHPYARGTDQVYDCALAAMANYLRELCGAAWMPSEVLVSHARRANDRPYRALLRIVPRFNAEACVIRFPSRWMERPVACVAPARAAGATSLEDARSPDLIQQVFRALRRLLLEGRTSGDAVAKAVGLNRRTLNRRLQARGLTFQCVLDEMRFGLARQLLSTSDIALDDLAANLGYSGTSPFARTFSRWSGTAPGRWRRGQVEPFNRPAPGGR